VRPEHQALVEPRVVSWGWRPPDPGPSPFVDEIERQATHDPSAYLSVPAAIAYRAERDWAQVVRECHELARLARWGMAELTGLAPLVPDDPAWFSQMATMPLPAWCSDTAALKQRLYDRYRIEIPITQWGDVACLRISVQGYNTRADIDRLLAAMADILHSKQLPA
jgi:isopenicillin-N epimerase